MRTGALTSPVLGDSDSEAEAGAGTGAYLVCCQHCSCHSCCGTHITRDIYNMCAEQCCPGAVPIAITS